MIEEFPKMFDEDESTSLRIHSDPILRFWREGYRVSNFDLFRGSSAFGDVLLLSWECNIITGALDSDQAFE